MFPQFIQNCVNSGRIDLLQEEERVVRNIISNLHSIRHDNPDSQSRRIREIKQMEESLVLIRDAKHKVYEILSFDTKGTVFKWKVR